MLGTYNPHLGGADLGACQACLEGYFCPAGSISANSSSQICPEGYYCPLSTQFGSNFIFFKL